MAAREIAVREPVQTNVLTAQQLKYIAHTEFVPVGLRGKEPAILACVATGRALGIDDMTALRSIHIIDGKATFSAELMVQLVRRAGHSIQGNFSGDSCTVNGKRADNGDEMTVTWTKEMAQEAGLLGKNNWKKYGASMLWARAVSQLARMLFADCFAGATYTEDEIGEGEYAEIPDSAGEPQTEETTALPELAVSTVPAAPTPPEGVQPAPAETPPAVHSFLDADDLAVIAQENAPLLTLNDLVTLVNQHQVDHAVMTAAIGRLFPGKGRASELSDVERGVLWDEVAGG